MKTFCLAIGASLLLTFAACDKGGTTTTPTTPTTTPKMKFSVNNVVDIVCKQYRDTTVYFTPGVIFDSGVQESLTITPGGMPSGITVSPASISGTPAFGGVFTFVVNTSVSGVYPINVVCSTASGTVKNYSFNITIQPNSSTTGMFSGNWTVHTTCTPLFSSPSDFTSTITAITTTPPSFSLPSYYGAVVSHLDTTNNTLTTDFRHTVDFDISAGSGTYTTTTVNYSYTLTEPSSTTHAVTVTLTKQ